MTDAEKILVAKQYLRWKYAGDVESLKALAHTRAEGALMR
jgi:hypothetical protein